MTAEIDPVVIDDLDDLNQLGAVHGLSQLIVIDEDQFAFDSAHRFASYFLERDGGTVCRNFSIPFLFVAPPVVFIEDKLGRDHVGSAENYISLYKVFELSYISRPRI